MGFGRSPVNLISQNNIIENRPRLELESFPAVIVLNNNIGAGDISRHQVRGELNSGKPKTERLAQGFDQKRLTDTGNAFQQDMPAG